MQGMRYDALTIGLLSVAPAIVCATPEDEAYNRLAAGLKAEVRLLTGITDAATAAAAVEPLQQLLHELAELNAQTNEKELWRYIDNTPNLKQPLVEEVERLFVQLQRLEQAECFGCAPLQQLLAPIFKPAS